MEDDQLYYSDGDRSVDAHFARFGSTSYAIPLLTSIEVKKSTGDPKIAAYGTLAVFFGGVVAVASVSDRSWLFVGLGLVAVLVGIGMIMAMFMIEHELVLHTAGAENVAFKSADQEVVQKVRTAVEAAMIESQRANRGQVASTALPLSHRST